LSQHEAEDGERATGHLRQLSLRPSPGLTSGHQGGTHQRTPKTAERIAQAIVRDIVAQGLRTGDRLPLEAAMVEQYAASRASVREALRLLEVQGLIGLRPGPGGGPVVGTVAAEHLAKTSTLYFHLAAATYGQLLETQVLFEPICAQLAAQHPERREAMRPFFDPRPPATEHQFRQLTSEFHNAVYRLAANPVLTLLTEAVTSTVTEHVVVTMDPVELRPAILEEHVALARAIAAGHTEKAHRLMAAHYEEQRDYFREHWPARLANLIEWR
jgi:DNA-binding FadR family transcriptional regulator